MLSCKLIIAVFVSCFCAVPFVSPVARAQETPAEELPVQEEWLLYGSPLMSPRERAEFRVRMRNARTAEQEETIRREHYRQMQERARQQGFTLPGGAAGVGQDGASGAGARPDGGMLPDGQPAARTRGDGTQDDRGSVPLTPGREGPGAIAPAPELQRSNGPVPGSPVPGGPVPGGSVPGGSVPRGTVHDDATSPGGDSTGTGADGTVR